MPLILPFDGKTPRIHPTAFVAENATVIGDVEIGPEASVWFGAVLRGDVGSIRIGARSNVQDLSCVHVTDGLSVTVVGEDVTVGHSVILHGCRIGDRCLVGMGSVVLDNAVLGDDCVLGAGSLVTQRTEYPARRLLLGRPAKAIREVTKEEAEMGIYGARHYVETAKKYR